MRQDKMNLLVKGHTFTLCLWRRFPCFQHHQLLLYQKLSSFLLLTRVNFEKIFYFLNKLLFGGKRGNSSKYKRKRNISLPYFSHFSIISFFNPKSIILLRYQIMGVKHGLRSSFAKFSEPSPSKSSKPLLGGNENLSIEEQWIIPFFFEVYLFDKSLDCDLTPCSEDPLHEYGMHDGRDIKEIIYEGKPSIPKILNFFS